jgi:hypothetical protein
LLVVTRLIYFFLVHTPQRLILLVLWGLSCQQLVKQVGKNLYDVVPEDDMIIDESLESLFATVNFALIDFVLS